MNSQQFYLLTVLFLFNIYISPTLQVNPAICPQQNIDWNNLNQFPNIQSGINVCSFSGLINLAQLGRNYFYWYFPSNSNTADISTIPLIVWLSGGPGNSTFSTIFYENGPLYINQQQNVFYRQGSWIEQMSVLYIEAPAGVGFSTYSQGNLTTDIVTVASDLQIVLNQFLTIHPEIKANNQKISILGRDFGAKYAIQLSFDIIQNKTTIIPYRNLILDNPLINAAEQQTNSLNAALGLGIITKEFTNILSSFEVKCINAILQGNLNNGNICQSISQYLQMESGLSTLDVRVNVMQLNQSSTIENYFNFNHFIIKNVLKIPDYSQFSLFSTVVWNQGQSIFGETTTQIILQQMIIAGKRISLIQGEFNLYNSLLGLQKLFLAFNEDIFIKKNIYIQGAMANNGTTFGYFYNFQNFFYVAYSAGLIINDWLTASNELVYNLAMENNICYNNNCNTVIPNRCQYLNNCNAAKNQGICDINTGTCQCQIGYGLADCSQKAIQIPGNQNQPIIIYLEPRQQAVVQQNLLNDCQLVIQGNPGQQLQIYGSYLDIVSYNFDHIGPQQFQFSSIGAGQNNSGYHYIILKQTSKLNKAYITIMNSDFINNQTIIYQAKNTTQLYQWIKQDNSPWQKGNAGYTAGFALFMFGTASIFAGIMWTLRIKYFKQ